jgi:2-polyprenyl-3-methyl-5-hydroxy-6-metoxy-1,4-benzoquinol methylase
MTFFVASGEWTLCLCCNCGSSYLNPRPTPESIGKAYENYYTHKDGDAQIDLAKLSFLRRIRRTIANGYINYRYGTNRSPAIEGFTIFADWFPQRSVLDSQFRYLPKPNRGQSLLDIGCGNGDFLIKAKEMGWEASGLEPDSAAVEVALERGLDVCIGTIEALDEFSSCYDAITLSHVIEHVYQPRKLLQALHRLLKNEGIVYIDTPNIQSYGAKLFGRSWRGVETPRHLTLFNPKSLKELLISCGFDNIEFLRRTDVQYGMYESSKKIYDLQTQNEASITKFGWWNILMMNSPFIKTERLEYITLIARKRNS